MNQSILQKAGIDYDAELRRFLGDEPLYLAVLKAFATDDIISRTRHAYNTQDKKALLCAVHEAKGSSGNSGMSKAYEKASSLVSLLRSENYTEQALAECYKKFETAYLDAQAAVLEALKA